RTQPGTGSIDGESGVEGRKVIRVRKCSQRHDECSYRVVAGAVAGNQRRPRRRATCTSRINTGTSTRGPMTAAKATGEARPNAAMATAIASSKLFPAAVKATAV